MGLMDKVKAQATVLADKAQTGMQQGQVKIQEMQTGKQVDHLLRELGAYVFLSERGRDPARRARPRWPPSWASSMGWRPAGTPVTVTDDPPALPAEGPFPAATSSPSPRGRLLRPRRPIPRPGRRNHPEVGRWPPRPVDRPGGPVRAGRSPVDRAAR